MDFSTWVNIFYVFFATLFGTVIGSFMNVVIYRIPEGRTVVKGHSMCMTCGHELGPKDLVPVFSWLFLGGKCRYCRAPISSRYIKIETFTGLSFLIYSITHLIYFPDFFDPTNIDGIILFAYLCSVLVILAALISMMMIYHDTGKTYYGYCIVVAIGALLTTILFSLRANPLRQFGFLGITVAAALAGVGLIALLAVIFKKKYSLKDFWLDMPFAFFYAYFGESITTYKHVLFVIPASIVLYVIPRLVMKNTKNDKYSGIASMIGILVFMVVGYFLKTFI